MKTHTTTKTYQTWELDGRGVIHGRWPLPAGLAPDLRTEIDFCGPTIVEIREWTEGADAPLVRRPVFEGGRLQHSDYEDPQTGLRGRNAYEYDERGFLDARQETDPRGRLRFRVEICCDAKGRIKEERLLDRRRRARERHVYDHDEAGRTIRDTVYKGRRLDTCSGYFRLAYDGRGHLTRQAWYGPDDRERAAFTYAYDEHDRQVEMGISHDGEAGARACFRYDGAGDRTVEYNAEPEDVVADATDADAAVLNSREGLGDVLRVTAEQKQALVSVAYSHYENGRHKEAYELFESVVAVDPEHVYAMAGAAASAFARGELVNALAWYDRALSREPAHLASLAGQAEVLLARGEVDRVLETLEKLLDAAPSPDHPVVRRARGMLMAICQA